MSFVITTSWDDGHKLDLKLADLLNRYGMRGSFYVARDYLSQRMDPTELQNLAQNHEIGAHTISHPDLTEIPLDRAKAEIEGSKKWLEDLLGKEVTAFCYPRGKHNSALESLVAGAGYHVARTVENSSIQLGTNPFAIPTSVQVYPYPLRPLANVAPYKGLKTRISPFLQAWQNRDSISLFRLFSWQSYSLAWLEKAAQEDGIWHLWGHSWEIENYELWHALERILHVASQFHNYQAKTNSELIIDGTTSSLL